MADDRRHETASESACIPGRNGGRLLAGGKPGNRGGGRQPSHVRILAREGLEQTLPEILAIAAGTKRNVRPADQVAAFRVLAQVGLGRAIPAEELRARLIHQVQVTRERAAELGIAPDVVESLLNAQAEAWR